MAQLKAESDALLLCCGATVPRDLPIEGRKLEGVHFAMEFLTANTKQVLKPGSEHINVKGKRVIVIGGGDTGNDCIGTSVRHGAASVVNLELLPQPAPERKATNPWPQWPQVYRVDYGHEEVKALHGKDPRKYCVLSEKFIDNGKGQLAGIETVLVDWEKTETGGWKVPRVQLWCSETPPRHTHVIMGATLVRLSSR